MTSGPPSQRASNAENASIWWRHHEFPFCCDAALSLWIMTVKKLTPTTRHMCSLLCLKIFIRWHEMWYNHICRKHLKSENRAPAVALSVVVYALAKFDLQIFAFWQRYERTKRWILHCLLASYHLAIGPRVTLNQKYPHRSKLCVIFFTEKTVFITHVWNRMWF